MHAQAPTGTAHPSPTRPSPLHPSTTGDGDAGAERLLARAAAGEFAAVLFDCDGTLVDSEPLCEEAWSLVASDHGIPATEAATGASFDQRIEALRRDHPRLPPTAALYRAYWSVLREMYRARLRPIRPLYDAAIALRRTGIPVAVVSNSDQARLEYTIACAAPGLREELLLGVTRDRRPKPAPDLYLLAAERLGAAPEACLVVEDSPVGAAAGRAAGMTVALVAP